MQLGRMGLRAKMHSCGRAINFLHPCLLVGSLINMHGEMAEKILRTTDSLMMQRGYSAFSYADISEAVGIRKASIHYHFPSKAALVIAVLRLTERRASKAQRLSILRLRAHLARLRAYIQALGRGCPRKDGVVLCGGAFGLRDAILTRGCSSRRCACISPL